jgi:hypothetical protein
MAGDPGARRLKRRESQERRLDPMRPDAPFPGYYRLSARGGRAAGGSATADKIMRMAFGFAAGVGVTAQLVLGMEDELKFSKNGIVNVPLIQFGFIGFALGVVLSPIGLWIVRGRPAPKYLLRGGFAVGVALVLILNMISGPAPDTP